MSRHNITRKVWLFKAVRELAEPWLTTDGILEQWFQRRDADRMAS